MYVYIGCRTTEERNARGKGITIYEIKDDKWVYKETINTKANPSYLTLDNSQQYLYTVHGDFNDVSAFKILKNGSLEYLNTVSATGKNPVYLTCNKNNKFIFVATLQGGTIATLPIKDDGSLGESVHVFHLDGLTSEGVSYAHQCELDKTGEYLFVPTQGRNIGYERIWVFKVNNDTGELTLVSFVTARSYAEPRHIVVSNDNTRVYLINEKGNDVTYYNFDSEGGILTPLQIVNTLPETYVGEGQASAIALHPNEKFLYATNRIHDSITAYRVNKETGYISILSWTPSLGKTPRFFRFSLDGSKLLVANEDSDTIRVFYVSPENGSLTFMDETIKTGSPTCIAIKD